MRSNQSVQHSAFRKQQRQQYNVPDRQRVREQHSFQTTTTRRTSCLRPVDSTHSQTERTRLAPGGKSPAYLQGKNPYGTVLGRIEHPYRDTGGTVTGAPSQIGAGLEGRLRTTGAFHFRTKRPSMPPEPALNERVSSPQGLSLEQPRTSSSVKATKSLFESNRTSFRRVSHSRPTEQPSASSTTALVNNVLPPQPPLPPCSETAHQPRLHQQYTLEPNTLNSKTASKSHLASTTRSGIPKRVNPFDRQNTPDLRTDSAARRPRSSAVRDNAQTPPVIHITQTSRTRMSDEDIPGPAANTAMPWGVDIPMARDSPQPAPEQHVRPRSDNLYTSVTECEEVTAPGEGRSKQQKGDRPGPHRHVRGTVKEQMTLESGRLGQGDPKVSSIARPPDHVLARMRSISPRTVVEQDTSVYQPSSDIKIDTYEPAEDAAEEVPSSNTRIIVQPSTSHNDSIRSVGPTADIGVQPGYDEMQVPDDIDWRAAYGRRKTQDFGFPGARIKPHRTNWNQRPLQAYSGYNKGSGRKSPVARATKTSANGIASSSSQPAAQSMPLDRHKYRKQRAWKQVAQEPSTFDAVSLRSISRQQQEHSNYIPLDKCGDRLANTLGYIIDDLLQEHSSSLQDVINSIEDGQREIPQLRRSPDKIEMHTGPAYTTYQPPRTHSEEVRLQRPKPKHRSNSLVREQFMAWLRKQKWQSPFLHCPPMHAEKLNVGATGQIRPNVNDSHHVLRQSLQTMDDLVDVIDSAADNFDLNLARGPTASDEERYHDAPFEEF